MENDKTKSNVNITIEHCDEEMSKGIRQIMQEQQDKGNLTFEMNTRRICDFCKKTLNEGDKFETLENGDDKCEECQNN